MSLNNISSNRDEWSSKTAFILAAAGSAVGLGNIWKFPYITGENGGGAFVIIYILCVIAIALPIMISEVYLGKKGKSNPVKSLINISRSENVSKNWKIIGFIGIVAGLLILSYYSVIAGWTMAYTIRTASGVLNNIDVNDAANIFNNLISDPERLLSWHTIFCLITGFIVAKGVRSGIETAVLRLMPALLIMLFALVIYSAIEANFLQGLKFMLYPNFEIVTWNTVLIAMGQAFFSLSLGMGALLVYGSYMPENISVAKTTFILASLDTLVALLAGLAIFPIVLSSGLEMSQGPGLIFQTLTVAFAGMPGGQLFGTMFFVLLLFAAWTSAISLIEPFITYLMSKYNISRIRASFISISTSWVLGFGTIVSFNIGSNIRIFGLTIFEFIDYLTSNLLLPIGGILISVIVGWCISRNTLKNDRLIGENLLSFIWFISIKFVAPLAVLVIMLNAIGLKIF